MVNEKFSLKWPIKPVDSGAALRLAALAKDYSPLFLVPEIAETEGFHRPPLHPLWLSSLIDAKLQDAAGGWIIQSLKINYLQPVFQGDSLVLEISVDLSHEMLADFKIVDEKRNIVASGTARIIDQIR